MLSEAMDAAAESGHLHVLEWLHENSDATCSSTAIDFAAANGHLEVVEYLHQNEYHSSDAFNFAVIYGHLKVVQFLHDQQVAPMTCASSNHNCVSSLELASEYGRSKIVEWLVRNGYKDAKSIELSVRCAASKGHVEIIEIFSQLGYPVNFEDIMVAASYGHLNVLKYIFNIVDKTCLRDGFLPQLEGKNIVEAALKEAELGGHKHVVTYLRSIFISFRFQDSEFNGFIEVTNI